MENHQYTIDTYITHPCKSVVYEINQVNLTKEKITTKI